MGVLGLTPFLQKACPNVIRVLPNRLRELKGSKIVLDGTLITQRLHFAPLPHAHRHVLGWYRILRELREAKVSAICVFDGRSRSVAKQLEVDRRREVRKVTAARGLLETDRLRRLRALSNLVRSWKLLDDQARETATQDLRDFLRGSKSVPSVPDYVERVLQLPLEDNARPSCQSQDYRSLEYEAYNEAYGEFGADELSQLLKRAGVPVSASGEFDPDVFDITTPSLPPRRQVDAVCDLPELPGLSLEDATSEDIFELAQEADLPLVPAQEASPPQEEVAAIRSSLADLYIKYKASMERFDSLPQTPLAPSQISDDPAAIDTKTDYMMSKTQHQLTVEEGAFWSNLADLRSTGDMEDAAAVLAQKSALLFESYSRRTHPPTAQTYDESKEIIRAMGVPCIEPDGPFEAEALAASMVLHGQADYVASEDTDVVVYGAPLVRNIAKRSDPLVILNGPDVRTALELDHKRFVDFAVLLGTDFSQRIKNVGPSRALKFIREHGCIEQVLKRETQYPPRIPPSLYLQQVEVARVVFHTLPPVPDDSALQGNEPDDVAVQEILQKYGLRKELSHDFEWDFTRALDGNYFHDNPAVA